MSDIGGAKWCNHRSLFIGKKMSDDKNLVIIAVLIITGACIWFMGLEAKEIVINALTGLFGVAVGKSIK